jgi:hypothetical protein
MNIYITQQKKKELEAKIASNSKPIAHHDGIYVSEVQQARAELLEEILSEAIVLPVEESWENRFDALYDAANESELMYYLSQNLPNGIIIKPKES